MPLKTPLTSPSLLVDPLNFPSSLDTPSLHPNLGKPEHYWAVAGLSSREQSGTSERFSWLRNGIEVSQLESKCWKGWLLISTVFHLSAAKRKRPWQRIFRKVHWPVHTTSRETFPCPDPVLVSFENLKFQLQQFSTQPCLWKQQLGAWGHFDTKNGLNFRSWKVLF